MEWTHLEQGHKDCLPGDFPPYCTRIRIYFHVLRHPFLFCRLKKSLFPPRSSPRMMKFYGMTFSHLTTRVCQILFSFSPRIRKQRKEKGIKRAKTSPALHFICAIFGQIANCFCSRSLNVLRSRRRACFSQTIPIWSKQPIRLVLIAQSKKERERELVDVTSWTGERKAGLFGYALPLIYTAKDKKLHSYILIFSLRVCFNIPPWIGNWQVNSFNLWKFLATCSSSSSF